MICCWVKGRREHDIVSMRKLCELKFTISCVIMTISIIMYVMWHLMICIVHILQIKINVTLQQ